MIRNRLYYGVKPLIPARIRLGVRGWLARRKREQSHEVWPILPGAERRPPDWPGWPEGKQFAFVLTHDVEGEAGVANCRQLMELEKKHGFHSAFNFIPEGSYRVSREFRAELAHHDFEVSLHDLYHDGRLYRSRHEFAKNAVRINQYLKDWGAAGFRSGFMFHNLEWLQDLDMEYDASTFDTDPFEPQPDGAGTIFPFWHQGGAQQGYVELPYTLPQDSTLFLLMGERSPSIWTRKLDWVAQHGGMALLNVHPDYIDFENRPYVAGQYPVAYYEELLSYVAKNYGGRYWNPLPKELARWYRSARVASVPPGLNRARCESDSGTLAVRNGAKAPAEPKRAAVVLYASYATDQRPRSEAEALVKAGYEVDVISLRREASEPRRETMNGVNLFRVSLNHRRGGKLRYFLQYGYFFMRSFLMLARWSLTKRYQLVHVHNMPDFLVFTALAPKWRGAKVVLDLHDPMPELFAGIYEGDKENFGLRLLKRIEKWSTAFADLVLTPNVAFKELFASRSCAADKIQIVMNAPMTEIFNSPPPDVVATKPVSARPFKVMYHGLLVERHGLDLAVQAVARLRARIPQIELHFYGEETDYMRQVMGQVRDLKLEEAVFYHGFKQLSEIAEAIKPIDLGVVPNRANPFTRINMPTRIFEYLSMYKPVIVPRTKGIQDYFQEDEILFFEPDNPEDLARKMEWVFENPSQAQAMMERGRLVYDKHSWDLERKHFLGLVDGLVAHHQAQPRPGSSSRKRICMVVYSHYERDNRVIRYAEELARRGDTVDVLALEGEQMPGGPDTTNQVRVFGIQRRLRKDEEKQSAYVWPLFRFSVLATMKLTWRHLRRPYDLVHVHNMPDFLAFSAWLPRLTGAKIILDIHDIMPEFYTSKFDVPEDRRGVRMLKIMERRSARFCHHVIISNHLWLDKYVERTGMQGKCSVFINNVNVAIFSRRPRVRHDDKFIVIFPGGLQWHQGLDIAVRAFQPVSRQAPNAEFHIYGDGNVKKSLMELTQELGLEGKVRFFDPMPLRAVVEVMANADLGVVPKRADSFGNEAYSTKIMEFMSLGIPVVVSSTKIDRFYFNDTVVRFFESGNVEALAEAMIEMIQHPERRQAMAARALDYAALNSWDTRKADYLGLVDDLCSPAAKVAPKLREA